MPTVIAIFGVFAIPFPWNFIVIGVVLLPQLLASFLLQTKLYKSKGSRFRRALWSLLTTPLFPGGCQRAQKVKLGDDWGQWPIL